MSCQAKTSSKIENFEFKKRLKYDTEREREREGGGGMKKYDGIWKIQTKTFDILVSEGGMIQIIIVCMAEASK